MTYLYHDLWCPICDRNYGYRVKRWIIHYFGSK